MDKHASSTNSPIESPPNTALGNSFPQYQSPDNTRASDDYTFGEKLWKFFERSAKRQSQTSLVHQPEPGNLLDLPRPYGYTSFHHKDQIRLFHLRSGELDDLVSGFIQIVTVEELSRIKYEAISYAWGDPLDTVAISATNLSHPGESGLIPVTKNLNDALRRVRSPVADRVLWADGICINQNDVGERGHQVRIMRNIYEMAERVLVWLGPDPGRDSDDAFPFLDALLKPESTVRYSPIWNAMTIDYQGLECLARILQRPWFTRIWILQEIGVAADATFFCGDGAIGKEQLFAACRKLEMDKQHNGYPSFDISTKWVTRLETHFQFKELRQSAQMTRFELFDMARLSVASDPRDMVYALLGHPVFGDNADGDFVDIDYSLNREDIYSALASQLLLETRYPLQLLSLVKHTDENFHERKALMSWVPEWDVKSSTETFCRHTTNFLACGESLPEYTTTAEGLYTKAVYVDQIVWQSDVLTLKDFPDSTILRGVMPDTFKQKKFEKMLMDVFPDLLPSEFDQKFSRILCADRGGNGFDVEKVPELLGSYWVGNKVDMGKVRFRTGNPIFRMNWIQEVQKWATGRRLFITQKGHLGLGPSVSRPGDYVCVFLGAQVPFVIRPEAKGRRGLFASYLLCGECYVDGIMYGEVINILRSGKVQKQTIRLV